jgi:hypothetical protein
MKKIGLGIVGLGQRGTNVVRDTLTKMRDVRITGICDRYGERTEYALRLLSDKADRSLCATDYRELIKNRAADAVYIATPWQTHCSVAIDFLNAGIPVALEVGGAAGIDELWELIAAQEKSGTPFMFMENCCYNKSELLATAMARDGIFGEIVHCSGAYAHDLRDEIARGRELKHYRLDHYLSHNCDNYPTHDLGPIAKLLDINCGNRMTHLISVASQARGMEAYIDKRRDTINPELIGKSFRQGDIVDTVITCENGVTIRLKLDTTLPRCYDREFTVRGTNGMYSQSLNMVFLDGAEVDETLATADYYAANINNAVRYEKKYLPGFWQNITEETKKQGHGGMDAFMFEAFLSALRGNRPMPIDVYDAASWMSVSCLSAISVRGGGAPVAIPDFTRGAYKRRERRDAVDFSYIGIKK